MESQDILQFLQRLHSHPRIPSHPIHHHRPRCHPHLPHYPQFQTNAGTLLRDSQLHSPNRYDPVPWQPRCPKRGIPLRLSLLPLVLWTVLCGCLNRRSNDSEVLLFMSIAYRLAFNSACC